MKDNLKKYFILSIVLVCAILFSSNFVSANNYTVDIYFMIPDSVYFANERIELKGFVYQGNYSGNGSLVSSSSVLANVSVNLTIRNKDTGTYVNNYTLTTDTNGTFYSKSNYFASGSEINASSTAGSYYIRAEYKDPSNVIWFSEVEISVVNQTLDLLRVSSEKATYNPSETLNVNVEAIRLIGDMILYISNATVNGSLRNSTKSSLQNFSCVTGSNGKCTAALTAPSSTGDYILEINNFKAFGSFSVIPFSYTVYMKDELGESLKNVFALGEQAKVEVKINNASTSDSYTFSGYIADSSGNSVKAINSTALNSNNEFTNSFLFTVDSIQFSYGSYTAHVTVSKTGDGSISSSTSFQVQDWQLSINKKDIDSGFEYEYSTFSNKTLKFEALPTYRSNGSVIAGINSTNFAISLKDNLNNVISGTDSSWNASCGKSGCYEFSLTSPANTGEYILSTTLSYNGDSQTDSRTINVIEGALSAQSTDKDGSLKELFGTNEYAYLTLTAYNLTSSQFNLSNAEVFIVSYMNGSEFSYAQVSNFDLVNSSNSAYKWAWNSSLQRIKLDVPKAGGVYNVYIFGNNRSVGAETKFIVNPYDVCSVPKDTAGQVSSGYYYIWQFKTTDTIYFEIKMTQANNPLGKATASNLSGNGSSGIGAACSIDTQTKQVVSNATITIAEVKNIESGALQSINASESTCKASDSQGAYSCTVKPASKWEGGENIVKFNIMGQDGTSSIAYSRFEARAFYLYGWSRQWQNNPSNNITLSIQIYEAGKSWWGGGGSGGLSGTVTVKKIEYQGRDGEWIWPPVDSGYNVSNLNSSAITSGYNTLLIPAQYASGGVWKTGNYRVVLQATTSSGDTDYGYAWFGVKLWDVYGQPIECTPNSCNYKSYFNSKENITIYTTINKAGNTWWSGNSGGQDIYGNVTIGIKKIQNCKTWPCKDLNSSDYSASTINVNASSPGYWSANLNNQSIYIIQINKTSAGSWGTGYYNVVLDVNGTDTGYAWFNTIAFYVDSQPTDANGTNYKYNIRGNQPMFFNVTTTKSYKWMSSYWNGSNYIYERYNSSDYTNTTLDDAVLRAWDQQNQRSLEYNYPEDINITPTAINGNALINVTFLNRTTNTTANWPTGYYWGELTLKNSANESSTGWLWFNVQPFRVQAQASSYDIDSDYCVNTSISIYDPDWYSNTPLWGNYSITNIYEDIWTGYGSSRTFYTNYTNSSFNATTNITICPNNGSWGSGSWGGYHYLNVIAKDNSLNDTQTGWLYFRTIPFTVSWSGGGGSKQSNENAAVSVTLTKPSGGNASGNLTKLYQWRYDNYQSTREEYVFKIGNCYSNVSGQCTVNGTANVTIYAPSAGWRVGYNYIQAEWTKSSDSSATVQDYSGVYFEGREAYNGYFDNWWYDSSGNYNYKYYLGYDENITIKLNVRNINYNFVDVNITKVEYAYSGDNCWDENCRSYTTATFSPTNTSNGIVVLNIKNLGLWSRGMYAIKATVSGSAGTAVITGGTVRVKDKTAPNVTISAPTINQSITGATFSFNATTTKSANCYVSLINYNSFYNWYCGSWNVTNSSNGTAPNLNLINSCNITKYNFNGSTYYYEYLSKDYYSATSGANYDYSYGSGATGLVTNGLAHRYTFNTTNKVTGSALTTQDYGMVVWCYDEDWNYGTGYAALRVNITSNSSSNLQITINSPLNATYNVSSIGFNISSNLNLSYCKFTLNNWATNYTMSLNSSLRGANYTNSSIANGSYLAKFWCNDSLNNINNTAQVAFTVNTSISQSNLSVTINSPVNGTYYSTNIIIFNFTLNTNGSCKYSLNNGLTNYTMYTTDNRNFNATNLSMADGNYLVKAYCNDSSENWNRTEYKNFTKDTTYPQISYANATTADYANLTQNSIYTIVSIIEANFKNITFWLFNSTANVNKTTFTSLTTSINWTSLPYTNYTYNVSIFDLSGNFNSTLTRHINLSSG